MTPDLREFLIECLKVIASIAIPYIALLRTRTDIDRIAALQRAKEKGGPMEDHIRKKWYHPLKRLRREIPVHKE